MSGYVVKTVDSEREREHHRNLIKDKLKRLKSAEAKEQGDDEDDKGGQGENTGKGSHSGGGGSGGPRLQRDGVTEACDVVDTESAAVENMAVLFYRTEQDVEIPLNPGPVFLVGNPLAPLAAANLFYDRNKRVMHVHEPAFLPEDAPDALTHFLPTLEAHAGHVGAHYVELKATANTVVHYAEKHGYAPHGPKTDSHGHLVQPMRKHIAFPEDNLG